jgi:hypothetical protein
MSGLLGGEVPLDRVVAVVADLPDGRTRWGSGFLLTTHHVLTAWHCTVDSPDSARVVRGRLKVLRHTPTGWESAEATRLAYSFARPSDGYAWGLDVAVLGVDHPPWGHSEWSHPPYARVDREFSGELVDCVAVGYPMYMLDGMQRDTADLHGSIRQGEGATSGYLTLIDDKRSKVQVPPGVTSAQNEPQSPWGGLSGAAVFHRGHLLGYVVQHRPTSAAV